jgi:hypothetical protein
MNIRLTVILLGAGAIALATLPSFAATAIASPYIVAAPMVGLLAFLTELKGRVRDEAMLVHFAGSLCMGGYAFMSLSILQMLSVQRPGLVASAILAGGAALLYTYVLLKMASRIALAVTSNKPSSKPEEQGMNAASALALFTYGAALPVSLALGVIGYGRPVALPGLSHIVEPWGASLFFIALVAAFFIRLTLRPALAAQRDPRLRSFTVFGVLAFLLISTLVEVLLRNNWFLHSLTIVATTAVMVGFLALQSGHKTSGSVESVLDVQGRNA